jgi:hypothetical protein
LDANGLDAAEAGHGHGAATATDAAPSIKT